MNHLSLNTAILSFAFSGVLAPHKREYDSRPPAQPQTPKKK
jgi:hypothetical protein